MHLKRKLIKVGNSRAVVIPTDWLKYHEDKIGPIEDVLIEAGETLVISPAPAGNGSDAPATPATEE